MKNKVNLLAAVLFSLIAVNPGFAATRYVHINNANPVTPYTSWATAATNIQDAVDIALDGDTVLVINGTYSSGGRAVYGTMTNRVAINKPITVIGVHGAAATVIVGAAAPGGGLGDGAIRCAYVGTNAVLIGFTLTNGHTRAAGDYFQEQAGGGARCEVSGQVANCTLTGNSAMAGGAAYFGSLSNCVLEGNTAYDGGGAFDGTLKDCILSNNTASYGGGAFSSTLNNCTLIRNSGGSEGGGACDCYLNNCSVSRNSGGAGGGASDCTLNNCTMSDNVAGVGGGAFSCALKNCTLSGNSASSTGGGAFNGTLTNCIAYYNTAPADPDCSGATVVFSCTPLPTEQGNQDSEPMFVDRALGNLRLQSNSPCINAGFNAAAAGLTDLDGNPRIIGGTVDMGAYEYRTPLVLKVWQDSPSPAPPYGSWDIAAHTIQDAVDAATAGDTILVTNGLYASGGRAVYGTMTNRVAVDRSIVVQSINGPEVTVIQGYQVPGTTNGIPAVRCVYLTNAAVLCGFTLTNGATQTNGDDYQAQSGGGIFCESTNALVTNCILTANSAAYRGGGAYDGTLDHCTLTANSAYSGGGAYLSALNHCVLTGNLAISYGGGTAFGTQNNCVLTGNVGSDGGGVYSGFLRNCTLTANSAQYGGGGVNQGRIFSCILKDNTAEYGGGSAFATVINCTLAGNSAQDGGGDYSGALTGCILYYNTADNGSNNYSYSGLSYCCTTTPLPSNGFGNITAEPLFVDRFNGNLRLQSNSPCIDSGPLADVSGTDMDGRSRFVGGALDIGAYEYQGQGFNEFIPWLAQCGLPTDGSADTTDADGDGLNNWQEWRCGTDPTNILSVLRLLTPAPCGTNLSVQWNSVAGVNYFLEGTTNLSASPAFTLLATNVVGQAGTTSYTDTNAPGASRLYRIGVSSQ